MAYELIKVEERASGAITEITIGPAPANIISAKMMNEISDELAQAQKNPDKKLIVFKSEGKHFSYGASVEEHKPGAVNDMLPTFHKFIGDIINCEVPTLAAVQGLCLGGAFEMVLACTFIFADEKAKFGVPEIQLAVLPPVASILLPIKCSEIFAAEVILTGANFKAKELAKHGLVNVVADEGELEKEVEKFFEEQLEPKSASSLRIAHRGLRMLLADRYRSFIGKLEKLYLDELMATEDAKEGILSFLEKRKPTWKNK